jgi:PWI domain
MTGFLEDKTGVFMEELVKLLIEAKDSPNGVPPTLIREKELEMKEKREKADQAKLLSEQSQKW